MSTGKAPLFSDVYQNVDGTELNDKAFTLYDGYRDELGHIVKRPGLRKKANLYSSDPLYPTVDQGIDGIFWWPQKRCVIAVSGGNTLRLDWNGASFDVTNLTGTLLRVGTRPSFATDGTYCFIANGGKINYTDGTTVTAEIASVNAPVNVSQIAMVDSYLLANDIDTAKVHFSNIGNSLTWDALDFFSAEGNPDFITAIAEFNREVYLLGSATTEVWENDGDTPFARIPGGMIEAGIIAPQSVVQDENTLYWLDSNKHFVAFNGREVKRQSSAFDRIVQGLSRVSDCTADRIEIDGKPFFLFHFPAAQRCLVLNYELQTWSEWGNWSANKGDYNRWLGNCHCFCPDWGFHLVGSRRNPIIWNLDPNYYADDGGEDGNTQYAIRLAMRTGHIDFGTSKEKRLEELRFRARRGQQAAFGTSAAPDDGGGTPTGGSGSSSTGDAWLLSGNAGTVEDNQFVGTTDLVPFDIRVNNKIGRRTEEDFSTRINIVDGYFAGYTIGTAGDVGVLTINGGYGHTVTKAFGSTIGGGRNHSFSPDGATSGAGYSVIAGGDQNTISLNQTENNATLGGVAWNTFGANTISGGNNHQILNTDASVIGGGSNNTISYSNLSSGFSATHNTWADVIAGGESNSITGSYTSTGGHGSKVYQYGTNIVGGGYYNILDRGYFSAILGGFENYLGSYDVSGASNYNGPWFGNLIGGGRHNHIGTSIRSSIAGGCANGLLRNDCSSIVGGYLNLINGSAVTNPQNPDASSAPPFVTKESDFDPYDDVNTYNVILGGVNNQIYDGKCSTIINGAFLKIGSGTCAYQGPSALSFASMDGGQRNNTLSLYSPWEAYQVDISAFSNLAYFGDVDLWIANTSGTASKLKFIEPNSDGTFATANYSSFEAQAQAADINYILPAAAGTAGQSLKIASVAGTTVTLQWA